MSYSKNIDYILILMGCFVAIYAQSGEKQNLVILIIGIVILMYGLFRLTRSISSRIEEGDNHEL